MGLFVSYLEGVSKLDARTIAQEILSKLKPKSTYQDKLDAFAAWRKNNPKVSRTMAQGVASYLEV